MSDLILMLFGALFVPVTILVWRFVLGPSKPRRMAKADPECIHCRGLGYDASSYPCTCLRETT